MKIKCISVKYLQLEDITSKYKKPCVIDIKVGKITYDPDASEEKKRKESTKYPPLHKIGFQLRGFRVRNYKSLRLIVGMKQYYGQFQTKSEGLKGIDMGSDSSTEQSFTMQMLSA